MGFKLSFPTCPSLCDSDKYQESYDPFSDSVYGSDEFKGILVFFYCIWRAKIKIFNVGLYDGDCL